MYHAYVKEAFSALYVELTYLFNESIRTGIFPREWVIGNITLILKEGDPLDPNNWRPVTILPLPSKLLEEAVHYQLMNYFQNQNLLDERQHGFRKDFGTATVTFKMVMDLFNSYNNGDTVEPLYFEAHLIRIPILFEFFVHFLMV